MIFVLSSLAFAVLTASALAISIRKNIELLEKLEEVGAQIEESLDILDEYHQRIDIASKTDVMFDDPIVKNLLSDITGCRDAVLLVANKLYGSLENNENKNE